MTSATVQNAQARTSVSVGLHFGDRYEGPEPYWRGEAQIVMVPGTRVYYVGDSDYDIYRYGRYWYMYADGGWYRSRSYRGPWIYVGYRVVPREISYVPYRYRRHWRDFRDDNIRYGSYRDRRRSYDRGYYDRGYYDRNQNYRDYRDRGWNGDGRVDQRDQNYDRRARDRDMRNGNDQNGQTDWRDQNRDRRDTNGDGRVDQKDQNRGPRDTNGDGQIDWRDRQ